MNFADKVRKAEKHWRALAAEFEVAESTVRRWASGIARPHPRIQKLVLKSLAKKKSNK